MLLLKIKNFILALLAIFIIFSSINIKANNSYNYDYEYNIDNGFATLTKYLGTETQIIIPEKIDGYPVKSLIETFADNNIIKSVMVPSTVTNIGVRTVYKCTKLDELQFFPNLESIGNYAFYETNVKSITFPKQLQFIGSYAFYGCKNLIYIKFTSQNVFLSNYAFYDFCL